MEAFSTYTLAALTFAVVACAAKPPAPEDIGTNFFLKASKSVPRIGRRTVDYDNYFLKVSKSIPRIGRRTSSDEGRGDNSWISRSYQEPVKKSFFDKYYKGNEEPGWTELEKIYREYPGAFQPEESYPEAGTLPELDPYWPKTRKDGQLLDRPFEPQT